MEVGPVLFEEIKEVGMMPPGDTKNRRLGWEACGDGSSGNGGRGGIVDLNGRLDHCSLAGMRGIISIAGTHSGWVCERRWRWLLGVGWRVTLTLEQNSVVKDVGLLHFFVLNGI